MGATKKILIAGACIFPEGSGGAVRCMHMLAKGFPANRHLQGFQCNKQMVSTEGAMKK